MFTPDHHLGVILVTISVPPHPGPGPLPPQPGELVAGGELDLVPVETLVRITAGPGEAGLREVVQQGETGGGARLEKETEAGEEAEEPHLSCLMKRLSRTLR